jgi:hypothetical protein
MSADSSAPGRTGPYQPADAESGDLIAGRFKLREKIGEGGMGEVWVAEQTEPMHRKVAVKLTRPAGLNANPPRSMAVSPWDGVGGWPRPSGGLGAV